MTPEQSLRTLEALMLVLPVDTRTKIEAARATLREMIKLDPDVMKVAISLVATETAANRFNELKGRPHGS